MIIPAPSVKVSVMMRPNSTSPRVEAGSRYRSMSEEGLSACKFAATWFLHLHVVTPSAGGSERHEVEQQRDHQVHADQLYALVPVARPAGRDERSNHHREKQQAHAGGAERQPERVRPDEIAREYQRR